MKKPMIAAVIALVAVHGTAQANAAIIAAATTAAIASQQASDDAATASNAAQPAMVAPVTSKHFGFVTCGKGYTHAGSLACIDQTKNRVEVPYSAWPGYRLGADLPSSYRVTGVSYDSYNSVATIYFEY